MLGRPAASRSPPRAYLTLPTSCEGPLAFTRQRRLLAGRRRASQPRPAGAGARRTATRSPSNRSPSGSSPTRAPPRPRATPSKSTSTTRASPNRRCARPARCAKAVVAPARRGDDQPLGRRRPRRLHAGAVRSRDRRPARPAPAARTNRRSATSRSQSPLFAGHGRRLDLPRRSPTDNPFGLADRRLPGRQGARARHPGQGRRARSTPTRPPAGSTATFDGLPQLPYSSLNIHFREGQRSPLATPADLRAYADRDRPHRLARRRRSVRRTDSLRGDRQPASAAGPARSGTPPFAPQAQRRHRSTPTPAPTRPSTCT